MQKKEYTYTGFWHDYVLDGAKILRETWTDEEDHTLVPLYDNEDSVCGIVYNEVPYYFQKNLQGDVIALFTEVEVDDGNDQVHKEQQAVARYTYDAWGLCTSAVTYTDFTGGVDIATINPFRYRSYYFDGDLGLYYLQSRYYDPEIGRFLNGDSFLTIPYLRMVLQYNLFAYCMNKPVDEIDPYGYGTAVLKATPKCDENVRTAIRSTGLHKKKNSVSCSESYAGCLDVGGGFYIHTFYRTMSANYIVKSHYLIGKMTCSQWKRYLKDVYAFYDNWIAPIVSAVDAVIGDVEGVPYWSPLVSFVADQATQVEFAHRRYINGKLKGKPEKVSIKVSCNPVKYVDVEASEPIYIALAVRTEHWFYAREWERPWRPKSWFLNPIGNAEYTAWE